jgi:hypothetical protein
MVVVGEGGDVGEGGGESERRKSDEEQARRGEQAGGEERAGDGDDRLEARGYARMLGAEDRWAEGDAGLVVHTGGWW